jgi:hypothetical protein
MGAGDSNGTLYPLNPVAQEMRRSNNFNEQYSVGDNNAFVYYHRSKAGTQKV